MSRSDPAIVLDLIEAFRRSKTMFAAVSLGVFDRLAGGPMTAGELAAGVSVEAMARLLDGCVALGLLRKEGALYANTGTADAFLRSDSPRTLTGYIKYSDKVLFPLWGNLEDAVREGTHRWKQTFGLEGPLFSHFFKTERDKREFLLGMHGVGLLSSPAVAAAFDLSGYRRLVDLGGATGHLARAAAERWPHLQAAVFDLPEVIEYAREFNADGRLELIAGDFFRDPLPAADLYAVGRILHDWSEEKIRRLLGRIAASLPAGGALLIVEKIVDEDGGGPVAALMQSLNMLAITEGRERRASEYEALVQDAGFARLEARRTGVPLDALLAVK